MKRSKLVFEILRLPTDYLAVVLAAVVAYKIRPVTDLIPGVQYVFDPEQLPVFSDHLIFSFISAAFLLLIFAFNSLYTISNTRRFGRMILNIIFSVSVWLLFIIAYYSLVAHQLFSSRIMLAHIWLFSIGFIILGRIFIRFLQDVMYRMGRGQTRLLYIGVNASADRSFNNLKNDHRYQVVGALAESVHSRKKGQLKIVGSISELESIVEKYHVDEIILADEKLPGVTPADLLTFCRSKHIHYYFIPEVLRLQSANVEMEILAGTPLISLKQTRLQGWGRVYKRLFDFAFSLVAIILLTPVWILVALLIKIDSRGPVFYKSARKYRDKIFMAYKFRSMVDGAEAKRAQLMKNNERKGPLFKIKNDPRVTRLGRFIRKTSIDELPQLFNVLLGNMSVVGPRPHLPEEVEQYEARHLRVFAIKPGITGLAQINGRSNLDFEAEVKLDFFYIENWSPWLDLKIILKTIGVVFKADGH